MASTHPIFAYFKNKFDLTDLLKKANPSFLNNFDYLTIEFENGKKLVLNELNEIEHFINNKPQEKVATFFLSNDILSFEFRLLIDSNLEISFYFDKEKTSNENLILKQVFALLLSNKAELIYLSNLDDDFEDHYKIQEEISNMLVKKNYLIDLDYIKNRSHYFSLLSFNDKYLDITELTEIFEISSETYLFLENKKDMFI